MPAGSNINLRAEIATALAVLAMVLQVLLSPIIAVEHDYSVATDYGLAVICGHVGDTGDGAPVAPPHLHDCPCCVSGAAHAVLPEQSDVDAPTDRFAFATTIGLYRPQVSAVATLSHAQHARAPPVLV